jgi:putative membrane protein
MNWSAARDDVDGWKGLVAGVAGGLAASFVMEKFQAVWATMAKNYEKKTDKAAHRSRKEKEPATIRAASSISEGLFRHKLTKYEKRVAGPAVHYAMGATSGAIYGVAAEVFPPVTTGSGAPFGAAVWLIADDMTLPAIGLAKWPTKYPASTHLYALASHVVYGLVTEAVRRAVRSAF